MKKTATVLASLVLVFLLSFSMGCTQNQKARRFGGTATIDLPAGKKLLNVTWKEDDLWYLVRDAKEGEQPETTEFVEDSSMGVLNGKVIFREHPKQ